jgi:asparagine synthase (glutamine-hydrolysing)
LDSSSIVAFCSGHPSGHYTHKCFTAVFKDFGKSEEQHASLVAKQFNLQHHLVPVDESDLLQQMDTLMWHQEEPVGSASVLAQYKVFEAAKQNGITVLLDGQGADELLAGYHHYYKWYWQELYAARKLKQTGEIGAARGLGIMENFNWKNKAAALFPHFTLAMLQSSKDKKARRQPMLNHDFLQENKHSFYYSAPAEATLNGTLYFNTFVYGLEELLRYADRNSMAHAVEVRLPFLNHQLARFLFSLPPHFKIQQGWTKWLLRKAVENKLPSSIAWRKDKIGFEPPQKQWMQNKMVQERIMDAKKALVQKNILLPHVLKKSIQPSDAHAANNNDWKYWSASYLFH